jgi:hypothetical protein
VLLAGCAHQEFVCGNALFIFLENGSFQFSENFRDDRLLKSDAILAGSVEEWAPGPKWKVEPYFIVSATLNVKSKLHAVELAVEYGTAGDALYSRVVVFSANDFSGSIQVPRIEFGGSKPSGRFVLSFKADEDWRRREIEFGTLMKKKPNQPPEPTAPSGRGLS